MSSDQRCLFRAARKQGWVIEMTDGNHYKLSLPGVPASVTYTSETPSDHRAIQNTVSRLRKWGFRWKR